MKISQQHPNRQWSNWLIYDIGDRFLLKYAQLYKGDVYDLGAGEAPYREFFLNYAKRYVTVDWTGSYHKIDVDISADLNLPLPIDSDTADTIVSLSVLEHLREPQVMLNEAHRILKPNGHMILQVPWQWWIHEAPYDYFRFSPYGLKYLFEKAGFFDIQIEAQAGYFTTAVLKWNYFTRRLVRGPKLLRQLIELCLAPFWYLGQKAAPHLDKLDKNWSLESSGYYVTAKKL